MNSRKTSVFIALILVLLIIAGIIAWVTGGQEGDKPEPSPSQSADVTDSPEPSDEPQPSDKPSSAPQPTAAPTPTVTPEPTPTQSVDDGKGHTRALTQTGTVKSDTGTGLNLAAEYTVTSQNDEELCVTVRVLLCHYSIHIGERFGSVAVNGKTVSFISPPVDCDEYNSIRSTVLYTDTFTVPCALGEAVSFDISASLNYHGQYSKQDFEDISASGTVSVNG